MSTEADLLPSGRRKCVSPATKESTADHGLQVDAAGDLALASQNSIPPASASASADACEPQKGSMDMDIDNDLTTNERMPTVAELEQSIESKTKPPEEKVVKEEQEEVQEQKSLGDCAVQPPSTPTAIKIEGEDKPVKTPSQPQVQEEVAPSSPETATNLNQRPAGKITRSSLNGTGNQAPTRTPAIMKRLRKSTRFKAKQTGKGNPGSGNAQSNGHNSGPNGSIGSSVHLAGAGAHPSNSNKHGKSGPAGPGGATGARNRRALFKRPAQKTPKVQASTRFVRSVFYKGSYMQIGDIVSIVDGEQNLYYAQIRGLLVDAYCEKSAFLTWLIPTQDSPDPQEGFDPATYLIGPDEELSRKLCYLEFVMHAPSNYYFDRSTPFPLPDVDEYTAQRSGGYIWTRLPMVKREKGSGHKAGGAS
ncbi:GATA zinc finger domain-containing protein 1 [Drosophila santomea]|uniref:GATA zinc finger domain-containing protein 1 n=1 Tax=Drosophila santomea TaxID=129105 RepID=UPI0019546EE8|nr:GATA zinc finger domain-containing protein 1 [Drosophila santomea]